MAWNLRESLRRTPYKKPKIRRRSIKLTNTSKWPTWFVRFIAEWLWKKVEPRSRQKQLTLRVRNTKRTRHGRAWWWTTEVTLACSRRVAKERLNDKYYRYAWKVTHELRSSVEMLVKIIAHELRHLDADQEGISKQGKEHDAEHWAWCRVQEWREQHPDMMKKLRVLARKHRSKPCRKSKKKRGTAKRS